MKASKAAKNKIMREGFRHDLFDIEIDHDMNATESSIPAVLALKEMTTGFKFVSVRMEWMKVHANKLKVLLSDIKTPKA